jgi:hypothetical protein
VPKGGEGRKNGDGEATTKRAATMYSENEEKLVQFYNTWRFFPHFTTSSSAFSWLCSVFWLNLMSFFPWKFSKSSTGEFSKGFHAGFPNHFFSPKILPSLQNQFIPHLTSFHPSNTSGKTSGKPLYIIFTPTRKFPAVNLTFTQKRKLRKNFFIFLLLRAN